MKIHFTLFLAFFALFNAHSQFGIINRLEIDLKDDDYSNHKLYLFGEDGFVIRSVEKSRSRSSSKIKYESYNNSVVFNKDVTKDFSYKSSNIWRTYSTEKHLVEFIYDMSGSVKLSVLNAENLSINTYDASAPKGMKSVSGHFAGDFVVTVLRSKKEFAVLTINVNNGQTNVQNIQIDGVKPSAMSLESISSMENSDEAIICIDVLDKKKKDGKRTNTYFAFINCGKGSSQIVDVNKKISNTLLSVSASKTSSGAYIVSGSYTSKIKSEVAEGLFISEINNGQVNFVQYNGFSEFEEFLSFLPERKQEKIEKKKAKKEKAGKSVTYNMRSVNHPVVFANDAYFVLAEYYHPTYRTTTRTDSKGVTTTYTEFDGYRYTHASLVKYDLEGKMQWDRTFELMPSYKPYSVIRFISMAKKPQNEYITMVFCSSQRIISKAIRFSGGIEYDKKTEPIDSGIEGDKTKWSLSDVDFWYDNYFMIHGTETIKNTSGDGKRKRRVYFVSKLRF
jgi:hypothetical protein